MIETSIKAVAWVVGRHDEIVQSGLALSTDEVIKFRYYGKRVIQDIAVDCPLCDLSIALNRISEGFWVYEEKVEIPFKFKITLNAKKV